jgi:hypothetical protein
LVAKVQRNKIAEVFKKGQRDKVTKASAGLGNFDLIRN